MKARRTYLALTPAQAEKGHGPPKGRLLLIDDDEKLSKLLARYLETEGYRVLTASDGESGLELVRAGRPDVPSTIPTGCLIAEKPEVTPDRDGGAIGRPEARQDDDRVRRPAPRSRKERRPSDELRDAEKTARLHGQKKR